MTRIKSVRGEENERGTVEERNQQRHEDMKRLLNPPFAAFTYYPNTCIHSRVGSEWSQWVSGSRGGNYKTIIMIGYLASMCKSMCTYGHVHVWVPVRGV